MIWLYNFIDLLFTVLVFAILARVLLSWFRVGPDNRLYVVLEEITEPILGPLRRVIPRVGMLDFSPLVAMIALQFIRGILLEAVRVAM